MTRLTALVAALAAALAATLVPTGPAHGAAVPEPANDPFYAVPANVASYANGEVIEARKITAIAYVLPVPANAWQIKYRTSDQHGLPTATVTTLMVPTSAWKGVGPRPLLSYQTAEDGVGDQCAPSFALRAGMLGAGFSNSAPEAGFMLAGLAYGWAVTVPDYEGPHSVFLAGRMEGQATLDAVRASERFAAAGLSTRAPVGIWGYSGGAFATSIAGQLQPAYAPELNLKAITLGGVVAEIRATIDAFSGSFAGGAIAMGVNGPLRAFPEYDLGQYLSPVGARKVAAASDDCIIVASMRSPFLRMSDLEAYPGALDVPAVAGLLHANSPLGVAGTPGAPVYDYHASTDELAPVGPDRALVRRYCADGAVVEHVEHPGEHFSELALGAPGALGFLRARLTTDSAPKNTCAGVPQP